MLLFVNFADAKLSYFMQKVEQFDQNINFASIIIFKKAQKGRFFVE